MCLPVILKLFVLQSLLFNNVIQGSDILTITQLVQVVNNSTLPNTVQFNVTVAAVAPSTAYGIVLTSGSTVFTITGTNSIISGPSPITNNPYFTISNEALFTWQQSVLSYAQAPMSLIYNAQPATDSSGNYLLPQGTSYYNASVTSNSSGGSLYASSCIERVDIAQTNVVYNNSYVAITVIVGLLLGVAVVLLVICLIHRITRQNPFASLHQKLTRTPQYTRHRGSSDVSCGALNESWTEVESPKGKKGALAKHSIHSPVQTLNLESIVVALRKKDKIWVNEELSRLYVGSMVDMFNQLRADWQSSILSLTQSVVENLASSELVSSSVSSKCFQVFQKKLDDLDTKISSNRSNRMEKLMCELDRKAQDEMNSLDSRQKKRFSTFDKQTDHLSEDERAPACKLIDEEQELERCDLQYRLKLNADLEVEKLNADIFSAKCAGLKSLHQELVRDIVSNGKLNAQQSEWLANELAQTTSTLTKIFNDAVTSRLSLLKDQQAKRKYLADSEKFSRDLDADVLNKVTSQHLKLITAARKVIKLSEDEARTMKDKIIKKIMNLKETNDKAQDSKELDLLQRSREQKKLRILDLMKKYEQKLAELYKKQSANKKSVEAMQALITERVEEMTSLEYHLDAEHANELRQIRGALHEALETQLLEAKEKTARELSREGVSSNKLESWLDAHDEELKELKQEQKKAKKQNDNDLKKRQNAERMKSNLHKSQQQVGDTQLMNYKSIVIRKLLDNQTALTSNERDELQKDCEVKTCESLDTSLSAAQQISSLVAIMGRVTSRRTSHIETLCAKQELEMKKIMKPASRRRTSDDEAEYELELLDLHNRHCEQRLAFWRDSDDEASSGNSEDEIAETLLKEQASSIRRQEEEIGTTIAEMQIKKAKPIVEVGEQQKIIYRLIFDLSNNVTETGVITTTECHKILLKHLKEVEKLSLAVDEEKKKEEKVLLKNLRERQTEQREALSMKHSPKAGKRDSISGIIKQRLSVAEQAIRIDQLGLRLDRESHQALEELRRRNEVKRCQLIQEQEFEFLADLTRVSGYHRNQLEVAIVPILPMSWNADKRKLFVDKLCSHCKTPVPTTSSAAKTNAKTGLFSKKKKLAEETPKKTDVRVSELPPIPIAGARSKSEERGPSSRLQSVPSLDLAAMPSRSSRQLDTQDVPHSSRRSFNDESYSVPQPRRDKSLPPLSSSGNNLTDTPTVYNRLPRLEPTAPVRPIIRTNSQQQFDAAVLRPSTTSSLRRRSSQDEIDFGPRYGSQNVLALPSAASLSRTFPDASMERKRKTVRLSESHQYYSHSDYDDDHDDHDW